MKKALAIITYARPGYLELVLPSILNQTIGGRKVSEVYDLYLFQDGLWEGESASNCAGHQKIGQDIGKLPPEIQVVRQGQNLGVAFHFDFIERLLFVDKSYDFVVFCEDDLVLAPGYMSAVDKMADKFAADPRIGMVSAHPADAKLGLEQQVDNQHRFASMGHNWGFGLSRSFWERRQPFVDCYLDLIRGTPYRERNEGVIFDWLQRVGFNPASSSQDYIKSCATFALGAVKLSTFPNFGLPIGRSGLHSNAVLFKKLGLDRSVVFDRYIDEIADLDDAQFLSLYAQGAIQVGEQFVRGIRDPSVFDLREWQDRLHAGEFHPERILADARETKQPPLDVVKWLPTDMPSLPHMEKEGVSLLMERLRDTKVYLEYGAGGSTVLAADLGVECIHSIDSDRGFLEAVKDKVVERRPAAMMHLHHVDIGPTKEWGQPTDAAFAARWPKYCVTAWDVLLSQDRQPDLILIDGRFRVACFLASVVLAKPGTTILFDDYFDRPHYHVVERHLRPISKAGRMAEFVVGTSFSHSQVLLDLMATSSDPA